MRKLLKNLNSNFRGSTDMSTEVAMQSTCDNTERIIIDTEILSPLNTAMHSQMLLELSRSDPMYLPALLAVVADTHACTTLDKVVLHLGDTIREQVPTELPEMHEQLFSAMYTRSAKIPAGTICTGNMTKVPTLLIVVGDCSIRIGNTIQTIRGFNVISEPAGMIRVANCITDCWFTTINNTACTTLEKARAEFLGETS